MPDEGLYIGPTALAPAPGDPFGAGHRLAQRILVPLGLVFAVLVVLYLLFGFGRVSGPSMLPTLRSGNMVLLTKGYAQPSRGDIIFVQVSEQGRPVEIVKRVIGLPGNTVEVKNDVAYIDGVEEPKRGQYIDPAGGDSFAPYLVPDNSFFVMGDNRSNSEDSRYIGAVPASGVMGRVIAIYAPINRIRRVF